MKKRRSFFITAFLVVIGLLQASQVYASNVIHIPNWNASACYDISYASGNVLYQADDTNASVDKIAGNSVTLLAKGKFAGPAGCAHFDFTHEGPTGVLVVGNKVWAGNGDSTVKVLDSTSGTVLATLQTGGAARADELDYIPTLNEVVVANPDEKVPFLTYFKASSPYAKVATQLFPQATAGFEQPRYAYGLVFQAIPATVKNPGGEIDAINPATQKILHVYSTPGCGDSGLAIVKQYAAIGCATGPSNILNLLTGKVTVLAQGKGADMTAGTSLKDGRFFFADYGSSTLIETDLSGKIVATHSTDANAHSVAVSEDGTVYVPVGSAGGIVKYTV